jgi:hypothetical protein
MPARFRHFAGIDWSGAVGERQKGIRVALCTAGCAAPALVDPDHVWSRAEVLAWLRDDLPPDTLVGLDLGTSLPFFDRGGYFPEWNESPRDARSLWALVDRLCAGDPHLAASSFVDHPHAARHFRRHGGRAGDLFPPGRGRWRLAEHAQAALGLHPVSNLNLVGAAQVGKSSLTGMRMLHRLSGHLPIWPFDPDPGHGSLVVEIYTSLAAREAGSRAGRSKLRDVAALNDALDALGSAAIAGSGAIDDHASDALLTAAWLRVAAERAELWHPRALTADVARIEGWTFGAP